jgi:hypothetical protein
MNCDWKQISQGSDDGKIIVQCQRCMKIATVPRTSWGNITRDCPRDRTPGVGDTLREIFRHLRFKAKEGCGCAEMIREMNQLGPDGCEKNMECFVRKLRKSYETTTTTEAVCGAFAAVTSGLAFKLDWTDPIPSLVRLAIERSRQPTPPKNPSSP